MKRLKLTLLLTVIMACIFGFCAYAGEWKQDSKGWTWDDGKGTKYKNQWEWIDDDNDGISERYYFDENGYSIDNKTAPDGCKVNKNGRWVVEGVEQKQVIKPGKVTKEQAEIIKEYVELLNEGPDPVEVKASADGNTIYMDTFYKGDKTQTNAMIESCAEVEKDHAKSDKELADALSEGAEIKILYNIRDYYNGDLIYTNVY